MPIGVYQISNTRTGIVYVGSSKDILRRWKQHVTLLNAGKHPNTHLQNAWAFYGCSVFSFSVLELCSEEQLLVVEQKYLDSIPDKYNFLKIAGSCAGTPKTEEHKKKISKALKGKKHDATRRAKNRKAQKERGRKHTEEHKQKLAERMRGNTYANGNQNRKGAKVSDEAKRKLRKANLGKKLSEETKAKMREAQQRRRQREVLNE